MKDTAALTADGAGGGGLLPCSTLLTLFSAVIERYMLLLQGAQYPIHAIPTAHQAVSATVTNQNNQPQVSWYTVSVLQASQVVVRCKGYIAAVVHMPHQSSTQNLAAQCELRPSTPVPAYLVDCNVSGACCHEERKM